MCRSASAALRHCPPLASSAMRNMRFLNAVAATRRCGRSSLRARARRASANLPPRDARGARPGGERPGRAASAALPTALCALPPCRSARAWPWQGGRLPPPLELAGQV